jgi:hypothetical protein
VSVFGALKTVEQDLRREFVHAHGPAHLKQFAALFAGAFLTAVASGGWHVAGWAALGSLAMGALGAAARQVWPQLPLKAAMRVVRDAQAVADRPAPPSPAVISTPTLKVPGS